MKIRHYSFWITLVIALAGLTPRLMSAQVNGAELRGTVVDASTAALPGAIVVATEEGTGVARKVTANGAGAFDLPDLKPGKYMVHVSATGFNDTEITVTLTVGAVQELNAKMTVKGDSTSVTVSAQASTIELGNAQLGGLVDERTIRQLPLNGRDYTQLATLEPGVNAISTQNPTNGGASSRGNRGFGSQLSISGSRPSMNNYFLDGIGQNDYVNSSPGSALGLSLGVDAIQEFSVITASYNAGYGNTSGGVLNAITRSGTKRFHGSAYDFLRNDKFDAENYTDTAKFPFRRNQFGGTVDGPIFRDKTFFFLNYEGYRSSLTSSVNSFVPSVDARAKAVPAIVPFLALFPIPTGAPLAGDLIAPYSFASKLLSIEDFGTARVDQVLSAKDNAAVSYQADSGQTTVPDVLNSQRINNSVDHRTASLHETHIFGPSLVNVATIGYNRVLANVLNSLPGANPAATSTALGALPGRTAPLLNLGDVTIFPGGVGGQASSNFIYTTGQFYDDLSIQRGKQSIKVGFNFDIYRENFQVAAQPNGEFDYSTSAVFLANGAPTTFLSDIGGSNTPGQNGFPERGLRQHSLAAYIQDDYQIRRNLTVNLGMRYEISNVPTEEHGRIGNLRDITGTNQFVGQQYFQNPTLKNFEPRVGFAYDPFKDGKTSVRGAFGIYDVLPLTYMYTGLLAFSGPFYVSGSYKPAAGAFPTNAYQTLLTLPNTGRSSTLDYNAKRVYVMQWNLNIQQQLDRATVLTIGFVGSHGVHLPTIGTDSNYVLPTGRTAQGRYTWPTPIGSGTKINPNFGLIRELSWQESSHYAGLQVSVKRQLTGGLQLQGSYTWQKSIDGSSSTVFPTAFQNSVQSLYFDRSLNRGPSDFDVRNVGVISGLYQTHKLTDGPSALRYIANNWELGGIFQVHGGLPFTPLVTGDPLGLNNVSPFQVPDRAPCAGPLVNRGVKTSTSYINKACFTTPPIGTYGNTSKNLLNGPGFVQFNASAMKRFPLTTKSEGATLEMRVDAFNLANRANFQAPLPNNKLYSYSAKNAVAGLTPGYAPVATGGIITQTDNQPRQLQFAAKLIF